jgi:hypothetical protein
MLRKKRRISESLDDDPMSGLSNLSDAMLVLALGFLIFAIMALSANPELISQTPVLRMFLVLILLNRIILMLAVWKIADTVK